MEDITTQRPMEVQLEHHASLLENVADAVVLLDADWRVTGWNRGAESMYGWRLEEVLGKSTSSFLGMELSDEERAAVRRAMTECGRWRGEAVVERKDGSQIPVEAIAVAIRDKQGELTGYLGIHRDITERRRVHVLGDARRQLEMILESIGDFFFALDRDWRLVYLNPQMTEAIRKERSGDVSRGEVMGQSFWKAFPELVGTRCDIEFRRALREQRMVGFETQGPLSGMWSELRVYPSASGVSVYSRDISQRKDAEQRVLQAQEVERTRIARALHDEALQGLGDAIVLAMAADRAAMGSPATRQLVGVLQGVGERLRGAIYGLRLAAEERTPFAELVEQLVEEHRAMMMAETPIELARGDGIPEGSLGERGLEVLRVIGEALTNVRRHARARHVRVHVWGANAVLWAEVSDDGCGFEPSRPASPRHHGISGMHERARLLGGRLEVDTEPDGGTTVRLQMSLVDDAAREV